MRKNNMRMDKYNNECYTPYGMCPRVEWCEKTKHGELLATIVAVSLACLVSVILLPVVVVSKLVCHILGIKL